MGRRLRGGVLLPGEATGPADAPAPAVAAGGVRAGVKVGAGVRSWLVMWASWLIGLCGAWMARHIDTQSGLGGRVQGAASVPISSVRGARTCKTACVRADPRALVWRSRIKLPASGGLLGG